MIHQPTDIMIALFSVITASASFVLASIRKKTDAKGFPPQLFEMMGFFWMVMASSRVSSAFDSPVHESALTTGFNLLTIGLGLGMLVMGWKSLRAPHTATVNPNE